jgi:hypothetical protein
LHKEVFSLCFNNVHFFADENFRGKLKTAKFFSRE